MARRLDYVPNKSFSRKFSHATLPSGSLLLMTAEGSSRPMSPVNSRQGLASPRAGDYISSSSRTVGAESERCFHVTRTAAAVAAGTVSNSGGLPNAAAAESPLAAARHRCGGGGGDHRVSISASEVSLSPATSMQRQQQQQLVPVAPPSSAALRNMPLNDNSRRASRSMISPALETRPSTPLLASPGPSRLHIQKSGGSIATGGSASGLIPVTSAPLLTSGPRGALRSDAMHVDGSSDTGSGVRSGGIVYNIGGASRTAGRAAKLLATVQRMGLSTPEATAIQ
ncbi:hypothetical protein Vretifemale_10648 [Volvox reticuliferus]|nr:hypothetical protein Vretifemale_10648 [Volvox reticuliferus]